MTLREIEQGTSYEKCHLIYFYHTGGALCISTSVARVSTRDTGRVTEAARKMGPGTSLRYRE